MTATMPESVTRFNKSDFCMGNSREPFLGGCVSLIKHVGPSVNCGEKARPTVKPQQTLCSTSKTHLVCDVNDLECSVTVIFKERSEAPL